MFWNAIVVLVFLSVCLSCVVLCRMGLLTFCGVFYVVGCVGYVGCSDVGCWRLWLVFVSGIRTCVRWFGVWCSGDVL